MVRLIDQSMRFGSLFSGFGGIDLGLERAGMECAWQVENDSYCRKVLQKHWPDVTKYGDIKEVDFERVEPVELLAGGFPCQDLSYAGKGLGLSGERSGLWSEFKRAIRLLRPRFILVENVSGLLGRGMGVLLGDLASLGYDAEWQSLPAAAFGAPHLRWRVFIVAHSRSVEYEGRCSSEQRPGAEELLTTVSEGSGRGSRRSPRPPRIPSGLQDDEAALGIAQREGLAQWTGLGEPTGAQLPASERTSSLADPHPGRRPGWSGVFGQERRGELAYSDWWATEPDVGRVAHGVPSRVDKLRGLGNAVVPQVAEYIGGLILDFDREEASLWLS